MEWQQEEEEKKGNAGEGAEGATVREDAKQQGQVEQRKNERNLYRMEIQKEIKA